MKPQRPRREKPLFFELRIYNREATIIGIKDQPLTPKTWREALEMMDHKGALPIADPRYTIKEMLEKGL